MVFPARSAAKTIVSAPGIALANSIASRKERSSAEKVLIDFILQGIDHQVLNFVGSHIDCAAGTVAIVADKGHTALVAGQLSGCGIVAGIDRRTAGQQGDCGRRAAMVLQTGGVEQRVDTDLIAFSSCVKPPLVAASPITL